VRRLAANKSNSEEADGADDTVGGLVDSDPGSKKIDLDDEDDDEDEVEDDDEDEEVIKDGVVDEARINKELFGVENDDDDDEMMEEEERLARGDANGGGTEDGWDRTLLRMAAGINSMEEADKGGRRCEVSSDGEIVARRGIDGGSDGRGGGAGRRESEGDAGRASSRGALRFASPAVHDCTVGLTIASCESSVW